MAEQILGAALKDPAREQSLLRPRIVVAASLMVVAVLVVLVRIGNLQIAQYEDFKTRSHENRVKIVPVPPTRGLIRDRNGVLLAHNTPTHSLEAIPESIADLESTLTGLRDVVGLTNDEIGAFRLALARQRRFDSIPLRSRLTDAEVARFAVNRHRFPGVDVQARLTREYPLGSLGVHALGYVGRISEAELGRLHETNYLGSTHTGKTGVERAYETILHGEVGYRQVETNAAGRVLRVLERTDPVPGRNIRLTIDISLQATAEAALEGQRGAIVAVEPTTGEILVLVSMPGYDPNLFVHGIGVATYRALSSSADRPLFNRAVAGRYPPGSTVKPFFGLAALELRTELGQRQIQCGGYFQLKGHSHRYRDWKRGGHGKVGLTRAIVESCDVYFYALALELGIDRMHAFMTRFGFGVRTGVDLRGESSGLMPSRAWKRATREQAWFPGETLIAGIGQGFMLATPLQLAYATAILAKRGQRVKPHVAQSVENPKTAEEQSLVAEALPPVEIENPSRWNTIVDAMIQVVHGARGTARHIGQGAGTKIAGKTGTSQVYTVGQEERYKRESVKDELRDHGLFVAFAPPEDPKIALAIVVEHGGSGSRSAAPIARRIVDAYLGAVPLSTEVSRDKSVDARALPKPLQPVEALRGG